MDRPVVSLTFPQGALEAAAKLFALKDPLCPECMGRFFGRLGHGLSNEDRLLSVAETLGQAPPTNGPSSACVICHGSFARIPQWVERSLSEASAYEWNSFLCGSRWDPADLATEEALWASVGTSWGESLRTAFNRELGKAISKATGKEGLQKRTDILFLADIPVGTVEMTVFSIYIKGRYRKYDRMIPQTRWPCRACRGRGCNKCGGTGKTYPTSVEELVAGPLNEMAGGTGHKFHGMGREDIDARMLGRGRPFIAEVLSPKRRTIDLKAAQSEINGSAKDRVEVDGLAFSVADEVQQIKDARHDKSYRVVVAGDVSEQKIKEVMPLLAGCELSQRTPTRVAHRRGDLVRHRKVKEVRLVGMEGNTFTIEVRAQAGTYVKEFVDGDGGRTSPSLSGTLAQPLHVVSLDVLEIHDDEGEGTW
jgi:tRNA pseudouridine synthase 10